MPEWTDAPDQPGWWWFHDAQLQAWCDSMAKRGITPDLRPLSIVRIDRAETGRLLFCDGRNPAFVEDYQGRWSGPIPEPPTHD